MRTDGAQSGKGRQIGFEPARVVHLRNETDVGQADVVAVAVSLAGGVCTDLRLQAFEPHVYPMPVPGVHTRIVLLQLLAQVVQYAQVVERVNVARNRKRHRAHARSPQRVVREQRPPPAMLLIQILDNRQRLRQCRALDFERRDQSLWIQRQVVGRAVLLLREGLGDWLVLETFQIERYAYAMRGGAAEERVELHELLRATRRIVLASRGCASSVKARG